MNFIAGCGTNTQKVNLYALNFWSVHKHKHLKQPNSRSVAATINDLFSVSIHWSEIATFCFIWSFRFHSFIYLFIHFTCGLCRSVCVSVCAIQSRTINIYVLFIIYGILNNFENGTCDVLKCSQMLLFGLNAKCRKSHLLTSPITHDANNVNTIKCV